MDILKLFDQFVRERKYLKNISPNNVDWYAYSFRAFKSQLSGEVAADSLRDPSQNSLYFLSASHSLRRVPLRAFMIENASVRDNRSLLLDCTKCQVCKKGS